MARSNAERLRCCVHLHVMQVVVVARDPAVVREADALQVCVDCGARRADVDEGSRWKRPRFVEGVVEDMRAAESNGKGVG